MKINLISLLATFSLIFAISCENDPQSSEKNYKSSSDNTTNTVNLDFPDTSNGKTYTPPKCGNDIYPCPPYGKKRFQVMEDFPFIPVNDNAKALADETGVAWMHNLYQLKNDGKKVLMLTISAGWCSVCKAQLPITHAMSGQYSDVVFLIVVAEDNNGAPATLSFAENYFDTYDFDESNIYTTYDPNGLFASYMNIAAYPFNAMIDLQKMEVIGYESGLTSNSVFSTALESALNKVSK